MKGEGKETGGPWKLTPPHPCFSSLRVAFLEQAPPYLSLLGPLGVLPPASLVALHPAAQLVGKPGKQRVCACDRLHAGGRGLGLSGDLGGPGEPHTPQGLGSVEVAAVRGEEELI